MKKLTAKVFTNRNGENYYGLHLGDELLPSQTSIKIEQGVGTPDQVTVTFIGNLDSDGVFNVGVYDTEKIIATRQDNEL
ncbi:hypothetical protein ACS8E3_07670 [Psychrobacter sp. 2Y5]|uniref:hypothetical protein n=1 Tax=unclassified Psychrobacter TaxID=196806 RepID=UPI003F45279A